MTKSLSIKTKNEEYPVFIQRGIFNNLNTYVEKQRRIFVISDTTVSNLYLETLCKQFTSISSYIIDDGERSKSIDTLEKIIEAMKDFNLQRSDLLIALGGGVVGDVGGLAASLYMRGIEYIMIPTTTLSQIDSSVGGKVAINVSNVKNLMGQFYHPSAVYIDPDLLKTLDVDHFNAGLVEAVKMGLSSNKILFDLFLKDDLDLDLIIYEAIKTKAKIVEEDEFDKGIRNILNFGHTLAHPLEIKYHLIHGQAVFIGMLYEDLSESIEQDLLRIGKRLNLIVDLPLTDDLYDVIIMDKKVNKDFINLVSVHKVGEGMLVSRPLSYLEELIKNA